MQFGEYILIISLLIVFYNYIGYAIPLWVLNRLTRKKKPAQPVSSEQPGLSFIVASFNEEEIIEQKILNSLQLDYPPSSIEYLFVTDGSTDRTMDIIARYPRVRLLHQPARKGKSAAVNRAVREARNGILIFSDANTLLNKEALEKITRHYHDPHVGGVAGEKKILSRSGPGQQDEAGDGEGMYWKYESFLKKVDSDFYSVVGAAGELFSLRRELYEELPENTILDDFVLSLRTTQKGFRFIYEPEAFAQELPSFSLHDEQKRKIRIAAGGFQAIGMLYTLFFFWKQPRLSYLYISHRVLRWTLSPLCLILAFISNAILCWQTGRPLFIALFSLQLLFYGMALLGHFFRRNKLLKIPYYFSFMNISVIWGFFRFIRNSQSAVWEKARRATPTITLD